MEKSLKEIAIDYKKSIQILNKGILDLIERGILLNSMVSRSASENTERLEIPDRLNKLKNMKSDLVEVTREVANYYKKGWWRSGKYTLNQNKPKPAIYSEPVYDKSFNKQRRKTRNENLFGSGYSIIINSKAKGNH